ncbi:YcgJ family protein, partial [Acinetobacter baumannii]
LNLAQLGALCISNLCATKPDKKGVSKSLTNQYLGAKKAKQAFSQGDFDTSAFTFSNGVFCDTTTKLCHVNKFFENGHRSRVDKKMTDKIFKNR